jgi:hypothetical protein
MEKAKKFGLIVLVLVTLVLPSSAMAWDSWANGWEGGSGGDWNTPGNWSAGVVPDYDDSVSAFVVQVAANTGFVVNTGTDGSFFKMQLGTTTGGTGTALVSAGASLVGKDYFIIGQNAGSGGSFTNNGSVSTLTYMDNGRDGSATFNNNNSLSVGTNLNVAKTGTAEFNNNGTTTVGGQVSLGTSSIGTGMLNLNSGSIEISGIYGLNIGGTSSVANIFDGMLDASAGRLNIYGSGAKLNLYGGTAIFDYIHSNFDNNGSIELTDGIMLLSGDLTSDEILNGYINSQKIFTSVIGEHLGLELTSIEGQTYTQITSIPEPATIAMLMLGSLFLKRNH